MRAPLLLAAAAACLACRNDFPPSWKVAELRVLAVTLDPPEVAPGATAHVRVVAVDPQGRPLATRWVACPPTTGATAPTNFRCDSALAVRGEGDAFDLPAPPLPGSFPVIPVAIRVGVCAGGAITLDADGAARCSGSDYREATRTLRISARERNANPAVERVLLDGDPWPEDAPPTVPVCPAHGTCQHPIRVVLGAGAREMYSSGGADGGVTIPERITTHFYATGGTLEGAERGDPTEEVTSDMQEKWTAPATAATVDFWFVVDDGRGGVTELTRRLVVGP